MQSPIEEFFRSCLHLAELLTRFTSHAYFSSNPRPLHTAHLLLARLNAPSANGCGAFARSLPRQFFRRESGHFDVDVNVDTVKQGAAYFCEVASNLRCGAGEDEVLPLCPFAFRLEEKRSRTTFKH